MNNFQEGGVGLHLVDGVPRFSVAFGKDTYFTVNGTSTIPLNTKTRITGSYNGTTGLASLYINGELVNTATQVGVVVGPSNKTVMAIGANPDGSSVGTDPEYIKMKLYSVKIHDGGLNAADIAKTSEIAGLSWDVSDAQDGSVVAWTDGYTAPFTVHVASNRSSISANANSSNLFRYIGYSTSCTATDIISNLDLLYTNNVTNMSYMFENTGYRSMSKLELGSNFDTSSVTNMSYMFSNTGYTAMKSLDLGSKFNTSKVTNMQEMFSDCGYTAMTSINLGSLFNTSNVTNMFSMFNGTGCKAMTSLDLGDLFYTNKVEDMSTMFQDTGAYEMTTLDLGPAFTYMDASITFLFAGKSGLTIYAPESIYKSRNSFKKSSTDTSTSAVATIDSDKQIVPKYRPEWSVVGTTVDKTNKTLKINIQGSTNSKYTSSVTTALKASDISVWIDGTELQSVSKSLTTSTTTGSTVAHMITITNFEQAVKQSGKDYREWSGNISLKIAGRGQATSTYSKNVLKDAYGNQSMSQLDESGSTWIDIQFKDSTLSSANASGKLFADVVKPAVMYEYANTTIDHDKKTVTVIFDVTDKYFSSSTLSTDEVASNITVKLGGVEATKARKTLKKVQDVTATINGIAGTKIGEQYQLVVSNLDQGRGGDYSGIMTLAFKEGIATDLSSNTSTDQTITIGIDDLPTGDGHTSGVIVDVVSPVWKMQNLNQDRTNGRVTVDLIATDKYLTATSNSTLKTSDITITVDGNTNTSISKSLSTPTISTNTSTGLKEIVYTLTLSNWKESSKQSGKYYYEYSGYTKITIAAGTVTDDYKNKSVATPLDLGLIDVLKPQIEMVKGSTVVDTAAKIATFRFNVTDKYLEAELTDSYLADVADELEVYVDGSVVDSVTKKLSKVSSNNVSVTVDGTSRVVSRQYSLKISGFSSSANQIKVLIGSMNFKDIYNNWNDDTSFTIYNVLKNTSGESTNSSKFLGSSTITRENIERIIFANYIGSGTTKWDVSAQQDGSIMAWTSNTSAPYTVYIGSNNEIFANQVSKYLFSYIGYSSACKSTSLITNLNLLNVSNVTTMLGMFQYAGYNAMTGLDLGDNFDTSKVNDMSSMFSSTGYKTMTVLNLGSKFNTSSAHNMSQMFMNTGYTAMTTLNLRDKFDTSNVRSMYMMFNMCGEEKLTGLDLGTKFNTSNVNDMGAMFQICGRKSMTSLKLGDNFDTTKVTNMVSMFNMCGEEKLTSLDLGSKFNTSSVTSMACMFQAVGKNADSFNIKLGDKFYTSNVKYMQGMFNGTGYKAMTALNLGSYFDTSSVTNMNAMFQNTGYTAMTSLSLGNNFKTTNVTDMTSMFNGCGVTAMTTLDLGPAFTKIADTNTNMFTSCGKSGAVINTPESIYKNRSSFKKSSSDTTTTAGAIAVSSGRTVVVKYKPVWTVTGTEVKNKTLIITVKGATNGNYTSNVTTTLASSHISVWIDGTEVTGVTKSVTTATPSTASSIEQTITISNFEETVRRSGKSYREWSGNITLKIAGRAEATSTYTKNVLTDAYGNQSMSATDETGTWVEINFKGSGNAEKNTNGEFFADFINPEFTYERSNTTINNNTKTVTIVFDVTDKYFASSTLSGNDKSKIAVTVGGATVPLANKELTHTDLKATINGTADTKIGERYTLVLKNLDQGGGGDYSGIVKLDFAAGTITDKSGNSSVAKSITVGIDDPVNHPDHTSGEIVDVVSPIWKKGNVAIDKTNQKVTVELIATDKYLSGTSNSILSKDNVDDKITLTVDGKTGANTAIKKTLSDPTYSTNPTTGLKEIKYTLTLTNWEQASKQSGEPFLEYSGTTKITIAAGTVTDEYTNKNAATTLDLGLIDVVKPKIEKVSSTRDTTNKTETIVFNVVDKYLDTSDPVALSEITAYVDGEAVPISASVESGKLKGELTKGTSTSATVNGSSRVVLQQYTLVLSNFEQPLTTIDSNKHYLEWSGTVSIDIAEGAVKDTSNNTNAKTTVGADFVDFIQPKVLYKYASSDINYGTKTFTMTFDITDKYYKTGTTITTSNLASYLTIKIDGVDITSNSKVTKKIIATEDLKASKAINKTINGKVQTGLTNQVVGKRYTLELSNLEQAIKTGDYMDYSGVVTVAVKAGVLTDSGQTGDGTNGNSNVATTITSGVNIPGGSGTGTVVDVVAPIWERSGSANTEPAKQTATLVVRGTDKYLASCTLTSDKIKIYVDDVLQTSGINVTVTEDTSVSLTYGKQFNIKITGFSSRAYQVKMVIPAGTLTDKSGNTNKETEFLLYTSLRKTNTETSATSPFLGNSTVQRQKVEKIILKEDLNGVNDTRWDVSAQQDESIIAWYTKSSKGLYTVYIGSYLGINANADSSYLFAHIGFDSTCSVTGNTGATDGTQKALIENIELLNTDAVANMNHMFYNFGHKTMKSLSLGSAFNTSSVTNMDNMFEGCGYTAMTSLNLGSKFDTSNVTEMIAMFKDSGYTAMTSINLGTTFSTNKVTNMSQMFYQTGRLKLTTLSLTDKFNTANVTNMSSMFTWMGALTQLNLGANFDTSKVTNMSGMFWGVGYSSMTSFSLGSKFNTSKVQNMNSMFYDMGGTKLTTLDLGSKFDTTSATDMTKMFYQTGKNAMTTLNLGPTFTKIADTNTDMFTNCGKSGAVINAPESIYKNRTSFKKNKTDTSTASGAIAVSSGRTVNPKYRPEWTVTGTKIDSAAKSIEITIKGATNSSNYTSNVSSTLGNEKVTAWIDGTKLTGVTMTTNTSPASGSSVTCVVTISNFEETVRRSGKSYLEWSGNIALRLDGRGEATSTYSKNVLTDAYGNQSMSQLDSSGTWVNVDLKGSGNAIKNADGELFADFIKPEFTYEHSNTTINNNTKTVTIVFDVTDKYFASSTLSGNDKSKIAVTVGGATVPLANKELTHTDLKATINGTADTKIGERYTLVLKNLDQGGGGDYSGIVKLDFAAGTITDESGNKSIAKTITVGIDDPPNHTTNPDHTSGVIVDVVSPVWRTENIVIDKANKKVTVDLIASDKYLKGTERSTLSTSNITVSVDGDTKANSNNDNPIKKTLSPASFSTNASTGLKEIKYTLTLSNWEEPALQSGKTYLEWSGTTKITIAAGTVTDDNSNKSVEKTFTLGHVDFIKPRIEAVSSSIDASAKTETIIFNVIDKYLDTSDQVTLSEITAYVDGQTVPISENAESGKLQGKLSKGTSTSATINGSTQTVSQQYTLVLSNFEQSTRNVNNYKDFSGTVRIDIAAGAVKDQGSWVQGSTADSSSKNTNDLKPITGKFIDVINPDLKYVHQASDINKSGKSYTMTFSITDKYYTSGKLSVDDLTIKMQNGQKDSSGNEIIYNLKNEPVTISLQSAEIRASNVPITNTSGTITTASNLLIGHTYTLTISNLEQLEVKTGLKTADYSGIVTVAVAGNKILDRGPSGNNTNQNKNVAKTITSGVNIPGGTSPTDAKVVDVVLPIWQKISSSANAIDPSNTTSSTATIVFKGTDSYYAGNTLTADKIKVFVNGSEVTSGITKTLSTATELKEERKEFGKTTSITKQYGVQYTFTIKGFAQGANQVKIQIPAGTLTDESSNSNKATEMILYSVLKPTYTGTYADQESKTTAGFLGNTAIQRQNIDNITFVKGVSAANSTKWDVSARGDSSILAWYTTNANGSVKVYIGSDDEIFANQNSTDLFAYVGYSSKCTSTETITNLNLLNVTGVTNMYRMFRGTGYNAMTKLDLGSTFNTSNVTNMIATFEQTGYKAMTTLTLGDNFSTSKVTGMQYMFNGCGHDKLTSLNLGGKFNTGIVTDMRYMFNNAGYAAMTTLTLGSNFNTIKVTNMQYMFANTGHDAMTILDLGSNFNTTAVTDMNNMFNSTGYKVMTSIKLGDNFSTSNVTNMKYMFNATGYTKMVSLDLGNKFDTNKVTDMSYMFNDCGHTAMKTLDLGPAFTKVAGTNTNFMTNCGTTGLAIYAPESVYSNKSAFYIK